MRHAGHRGPVSNLHGRNGFTLIEVLIALVVIAIGLLGLAKMQASALASTQTNGMRAIIAYQAESLAAAMHANRVFWAGPSAVLSFSMQGTVVTDASGVLSATSPDCAATAAPAGALCTPAQMASYDVRNWAANLAAQVPTYAATAACTAPPNAPLTCRLSVTWLERFVSQGLAAAGDSDATSGQRRYTLLIEP